ncbi:active regulator of SIRT1 [Excalfactoria chinensis]|uniref:active regulator of SIRT1 n=1 Tax=Excalfactoria chinensis TaxID=46218 RepID=UPI003B3A6747
MVSGEGGSAVESRKWMRGGGCAAMSASLIRRGLELLEAPGRGKAPPGLQQGRDGSRPAGAARRRKVTVGPGKNKATIKGRVVKSAIEEYHKKKAVNHLKANLQYMTSGRCVADKAVTKQVLAQNRGRKAKDRPPEKKEKKAEGTVFTEEDFRKFEREYFGIP